MSEKDVVSQMQRHSSNDTENDLVITILKSSLGDFISRLPQNISCVLERIFEVNLDWVLNANSLVTQRKSKGKTTQDK